MQSSIGGLYVIVVPILSDNFSYLIVDTATKETATVDPAEPGPVLEVVASKGLRLTTILTTHNHWDHAGGNKEMASKFPNINIVGGRIDNVDGCTKAVEHGETFSLGALRIQCLHTPFHTKGHICYVVSPPEGGASYVFTGDALFVGGCGRFFAGTPDEASKSLLETLGSLPDNTMVYCGHEYTIKNLQFAQSAESSNLAIAAKLAWARGEIAAGRHTVPSTIGEEKSYNPFMRAHQPSLQGWCGTSDAVSTMAELRRRKDAF